MKNLRSNKIFINRVKRATHAYHQAEGKILNIAINSKDEIIISTDRSPSLHALSSRSDLCDATGKTFTK